MLPRITLVLGALSSIVAATAHVEISIRDVATHHAVSALVKGAGPEVFSAVADGRGRLQRDLTPGQYRLEISAAGYEVLKSYVTIEAGAPVTTRFMLHPTTLPPEETLVESKVRSGFTLLHGYVTDTDTGQPVRDVRIHLETSGADAMTDDRGHYWLSTRTPPAVREDVPSTDTLIAEKTGFKRLILRHVALPPGDGGGYFLDLDRGVGVIEQDKAHKTAVAKAQAKRALPRLLVLKPR